MPKIRSHHLHLPNYTFDDNKNLRLLYGIRVIRDLANKMAAFFLPIFLFNIGSETNFLSFLNNFPNVFFSDFQRGMLTIAFYYVVYSIVGFFTAVPAGKLLGKIGYQRSFTLSFMIRALVFFLLFLSKSNPLYLIPSTVLDGMGAQFFWGGYYSLLSRSANKRNMGKDLGLIQFLLQVVAVISPAISGFIAYLVGLEYLFLIGTVLALPSSVLALMMDSKIYANSISFKQFKNWLSERRFIKLGIAYTGKYVSDTLIYLWPLYVFFILGSVDRVGYLYAFSLFLAMFFTFFIGKYIDKNKNKKPFYLSGGFISLLWIARTQILSVWSIALVDTFDRLATNVYALFFDTIFMRRGKGRSSDEYFIYSEMMLSFSKVIFWILFGLFFIFFSSWNSIFISAGVAVLVGLLISDKKPENV